MSARKARKEASKRLALEMKKRYNRLVTAGNDPDEITVAAVDLGEIFNQNIEFILWVLGTFGGLEIPAPEPVLKSGRATVTKDPNLPDVPFLNGMTH